MTRVWYGPHAAAAVVISSSVAAAAAASPRRLGKTFTTIIIARALAGSTDVRARLGEPGFGANGALGGRVRRVAVVCPANLVGNWLRE